MASGYILEVCGLLIAAYGLRKTYRENADGRPFLADWPWLMRLMERVTGGQHVARGSGSATLPGMTGSGAGIAPLRLDPAATIDDKLAALVEHSNRALAEAVGARAAVDVEGRKRRRAVEGLKARMGTLEEGARAYTRRVLVAGVPMAIVGLFLAGLGLLLQGLATWLTWGC
jgi:hypothetical protein